MVKRKGSRRDNRIITNSSVSLVVRIELLERITSAQTLEGTKGFGRVHSWRIEARAIQHMNIHRCSFNRCNRFL